MARKKPAEPMAMPVNFGNVSIGDTTARLGVAVSRAVLAMDAADRDFCCRQIRVAILARLGGAAADQPALPGANDDPELELIANVKGIATNGKVVTFGLTFVLSGLDTDSLVKFARREGRMTLLDSQPLADDGQDDEDEDA